MNLFGHVRRLAVLTSPVARFQRKDTPAGTHANLRRLAIVSGAAAALVVAGTSAASAASPAVGSLGPGGIKPVGVVHSASGAAAYLYDTAQLMAQPGVTVHQAPLNATSNAASGTTAQSSSYSNSDGAHAISGQVSVYILSDINGPFCFYAYSSAALFSPNGSTTPIAATMDLTVGQFFGPSYTAPQSQGADHVVNATVCVASRALTPVGATTQVTGHFADGGSITASGSVVGYPPLS